MKATLEFDCPDQNDDFMLAVHGKDFALAMFDLEQDLRSMVKHDADNTEKLSGIEAVEKARELLRENLEAYNVSLEMIGA